MRITVQFEVKKEGGDPVTGAAITVTNTGNQTRNISPADELEMGTPEEMEATIRYAWSIKIKEKGQQEK